MNLHDQLVRDEGLRAFPYTDTVGKLTIGVGRNLTDRGLSPDEVEYLLTKDIARCIAEVQLALPWTLKLDGVRQDVLTNMCFNLGIPGLLKFTNTLRHIKNGEYALAADAMLRSLWARQVGSRATRLATAMRTGISQ